MVFLEINPQALSLMTDVFGNYVVQKVTKHAALFLVLQYLLELQVASEFSLLILH